eukprot:7929761-Pyramimonas_sp.AAC.1
MLCRDFNIALPRLRLSPVLHHTDLRCMYTGGYAGTECLLLFRVEVPTTMTADVPNVVHHMHQSFYQHMALH